MTVRLWVVLSLLAALGLTIGCGASRTAEKPRDTRAYEGKADTPPAPPPLPPPPK
jgi:hypothetical protein